MRLLLDIGNTRVKWALQGEQGLSAQQALPHANLTAAQLRAALTATDADISEVRVSNVAGAALAQLVSTVTQECWNIEPTFARTAASAQVAGRELRNAYAEIANMGTDRWLAMLGAMTLTTKAVLVVSVGTAMTIDAVTAQGQHLGGMIAPGPDLMMSSLMRNTSDIAANARQGHYGDQYFADNTLGCVYRGAVNATTALIESAHARLQQREGELQVLLTGGAVAHIQPLLSIAVHTVPDLVLRGLAVST
jgi:type III pantothenate kinase